MTGGQQHWELRWEPCARCSPPFLPTALHQKVSSTFLPTAIKFHYLFNLRDLSNIFQVVRGLFSLKHLYSFFTLIPSFPAS